MTKKELEQDLIGRLTKILEYKSEIGDTVLGYVYVLEAELIVKTLNELAKIQSSTLNTTLNIIKKNHPIDSSQISLFFGDNKNE